MSTTSPLALAIAQAEGFNNGSAGTALNNPGDIFDPSTGQLASYSSLQQGWDALEAQIQRYLNGTSSYANGNTPISSLAQTYTGGDNPTGWASAVAQNLGLSPDATISQAANASPSSSLLQKLGQFFGGAAGTSAGNAISSAAGGIAQTFIQSLLTSRFVIGALGGAFIIVGILGFEKTQEITVNAARAAGELAA